MMGTERKPTTNIILLTTTGLLEVIGKYWSDGRKKEEGHRQQLVFICHVHITLIITNVSFQHWREGWQCFSFVFWKMFHFSDDDDEEDERYPFSVVYVPYLGEVCCRLFERTHCVHMSLLQERSKLVINSTLNFSCLQSSYIHTYIFIH